MYRRRPGLPDAGRHSPRRPVHYDSEGPVCDRRPRCRACLSRTGRRQDLLRPGDRVAAADGTALLVLLDDGHLETVPARAAVTVAARGCTPAEAVRRQEAKVTGRNLAGLRELTAGGRAGVSVF